MIKGSNKHVLEVTDTGNPYFEKVIFFVAPEHENEKYENLKNEAEKYSESASALPPFKKTKKQILKEAVQIVLGLGAGASISAMLFFLI